MTLVQLSSIDYSIFYVKLASDYNMWFFSLSYSIGKKIHIYYFNLIKKQP